MADLERYLKRARGGRVVRTGFLDPEDQARLEEMARRVYLSPSYFSRVFRQETGETFSGYLNRLRIERSKELLRHKELRLTDIAQKVGFEDQSYFTKVFKKLEGVTPLRYRSGN